MSITLKDKIKITFARIIIINILKSTIAYNKLLY